MRYNNIKVEHIEGHVYVWRKDKNAIRIDTETGELAELIPYIINVRHENINFDPTPKTPKTLKKPKTPKNTWQGPKDDM